MRDITKYLLQKLAADETIEPKIKDFFLSRKPGIIYGGGHQSRLILDFAQLFEKEIICLLVSANGARKMMYYKDIPLYCVDDLPTSLDKNNDVILGLHSKHTEEVMKNLCQHEFSSTYATVDWTATNKNIRNLWCRCYFSFHNFTRHKDVAGEIFWQFACDHGEFKFYFSDDPDDLLRRETTDAGLLAIVLPGLLNDYNYMCEEPYEYGEVVLRNGDVVLDLGANVGLFSGVAAVKVGERGGALPLNPRP